MISKWGSVKVEDIAEVRSGKRLPKGQTLISETTAYPYIRLVDVDNGRVQSNNLQYLTEDTRTSIKRYVVNTDDICLAIVGHTIGMVFFIEEQWDDVNLTENAARITNLSSSFNARFIYYYLTSPIGQQEIISRKVGSAQGKLPLYNIKSLEIPNIPRVIQDKIVGILDSLSLKYELNTETNQILEEMAQAIFKSWFVDFEPVKAKMKGEQPEGMDAATASLFPEKLVESELGLIPEGWDVDQVDNHIDVTKGKSYKSAELQESTTALVTLKSFKRGGGYRMDGLKEYTGKYKPQQVIEAGDLVMSLTDVTQAAEIVGKPALVIDAPQYDTLVASLDVAILRSKEADAKQYFYGLMSTYRFHRYAESFATGTTVLHLSPKGITTFEFACPSAELVKKYNDFSAPIFAKIEANILESKELAKLRDTLLPKLLSGEINLDTTEINLDTTEELVEVN